jgi:hypothetical protein
MKKAEGFFISIGVAALFLVLVLVALHCAILLWEQYKSTHHRLTALQTSAYKHMSNDQIQDLLAWTYDLGYVFEPWLGFKEKARRSTYVNVSALGTRFNNANDNPDDKTEGSIWFFGGSTTFGYGVADSETIPAQLESLIKQPVINFGSAFYYSAQETFMLSSLLKSGFKPSAVIFLDGLNERCNLEFYQTEFSRLFSKAQTYNWDPTEIFRPLFNIAKKLEHKIGIRSPHADKSYSHECESRGKTLSLSYVMAGNFTERMAICKQYSLKCHVFIQPFAGVHGLHQDYEMLPPENRKYFSDKFSDLSPIWKEHGALFVTDALDSLHEHAYVDGVHYTATAGGLIAKAIAGHLQDRH